MLISGRQELERIFPPRTEVSVHPGRLGQFRGFCAQFKYNDIRTLIFLFSDGSIELLTRRREAHRDYKLTPRMEKALRSLDLNPERNHVLDGGILRHFTSPRNGERPLVIWDILVHDDEYLLGTAYEARYSLLRKICREPSESEKETGRSIGWVVKDQLWLAPVFRDGFAELFKTTLEPDYLEGLVLKDPRGKLEPGLAELNNSRWQFKVRKPRADYQF